jgi:hypothetical protein
VIAPFVFLLMVGAGHVATQLKSGPAQGLGWIMVFYGVLGAATSLLHRAFLP